MTLEETRTLLRLAESLRERSECPHRWVQSDGERVWCARCGAPMRHDPVTGGYRAAAAAPEAAR